VLMPPKTTPRLDSSSAGLVLGFDARETWLPDSGGWDPKRRNDYLLRLDVTKPLSMDRNVWGSIFDLRPDLVPAYTRWGPHLNDAHLFPDRSQAERFKSFSNERVPEHVPFYVVSLWGIP